MNTKRNISIDAQILVSKNNTEVQDERQSLRWFVQHILLPACRTRYYPRKEFATDGTILQIAALENLYRQFERC